MKNPFSIRTLLLAGSILLQLSALCPRSHGAAGDVDLSFNPELGVNGMIRALVKQPDGKVIIGGDFTTVRGVRQPRLARLNADGSGDPGFRPAGFNNFVESIALQPDGKVLVGIQVTLTECYEDWGCVDYLASKLTRLNADGSIDPTFSNVTFTVYEGYGTWVLLVEPDGRIIVGGQFTHVNGTARSGIARLNADGTLDMTFDPGAGIGGHQAQILSLARQSDGKILVAGGFRSFAGTNVRGLARLNPDGSLDTVFDTGIAINGYIVINSVALQPDNKVLVAGMFTNANGKCVARFHPNGSLDVDFAPDLPIGPVTSPSDSAAAYAMALQSDGKLIVAGTTTHFEGCDEIGGNCGPSTTTSYIVRLNANGSRDPAFTSSTANPANWTTFRGMALQPDGRALIAGSFTELDGKARNRISRLNPDGGEDETFHAGQGLVGAVSRMALQTDDKLLVGGPLDESLYWSAGNVYPLVDGANQYGSARLNADGSSDRMFVSDKDLVPNLSQFFHLEECFAIASSCDPSVMIETVIVQPDGKKLLAGYALTTVGTEASVDYFSYPLFSRLNPDGSVDTSFTPPSNVYPSTILLQPDGKMILVGNFTLNGTPSTVVRLHPNGSVDAGFQLGNGPPSASCLALMSDGRIVVGGGNSVVRLHGNGSRDLAFTAAVISDGAVMTIVTQPDGKAVIAGAFTTVNGSSRQRIARLNADGSLDLTFNPGAGANAVVRTMALQPDGKVLIAGDFTTVDGMERTYVARLHSDASEPSFAAWAAGYGLAGTAAAADADPDFDGLTNSVEYILSGNPNVPATSSSPRAAVSLSGGNMVFTFPRSDTAESPNVTLAVESSTDLATWPAVFTVGRDTATSSSGVTITENGTAPDTITVAIPRGTATRMFARLKVTIAP